MKTLPKANLKQNAAKSVSQSPSALSISTRVASLRVDVEGRKISHFGFQSLARMLIDVEIDIVFRRSLCQ